MKIIIPVGGEEILDAFLDQHHGGVGANHGNTIVEQVFERLFHVDFLLGVEPGHDLGFDFFEVIIRQCSQNLGNYVKVSGDVTMFGTAFRAQKHTIFTEKLGLEKIGAK